MPRDLRLEPLRDSNPPSNGTPAKGIALGSHSCSIQATRPQSTEASVEKSCESTNRRNGVARMAHPHDSRLNTATIGWVNDLYGYVIVMCVSADLHAIVMCWNQRDCERLLLTK